MKYKVGDRVMIGGPSTKDPATIIKIEGKVITVRYDKQIGNNPPKESPVAINRVSYMK